MYLVFWLVCGSSSKSLIDTAPNNFDLSILIDNACKDADQMQDTKKLAFINLSGLKAKKPQTVLYFEIEISER